MRPKTSIELAIDRARKAFEGEAEKLELKDEEDVANMIKELREGKS